MTADAKFTALLDAIERMIRHREWLAAERERKRFERKIRRNTDLPPTS
jgi:hypothetical protein